MHLPKIRDYLSIYKYNNKVGIGDTPNRALEISDPEGIFYKFVKLCDGTRTKEEIFLELNNKNISFEELIEWLDVLSNEGYILEDELDNQKFMSDSKNERHLRNINFLSNFSADSKNKFDYIERIQKQNVLLLGLGGVGSVILYNLAALGVEKITGVDFDTVDTTNLNRQILYGEKDIGRKKTESSEKTISDFNSDITYKTLDIKIESYDQLENIIQENDFDFIFCAADTPPFLLYQWVDEISENYNIPWMYGGTREAISSYSLIVPNKTYSYRKSFRAHLEKSNGEALEKYNYVKENKPKYANNCIAASSSILSSFMIFDFIKYVTGMEQTLSNDSIIYFDYRNMEFNEVKI